MENVIKLLVYTFDQEFSEQSSAVTIPSSCGPIQILPHYISSVFSLTEGIVIVCSNEKSLKSSFYIFGGIARFENNCLQILTNYCVKNYKNTSNLLNLPQQIFSNDIKESLLVKKI